MSEREKPYPNLPEDPGADDEELDTEAAERAANEGMLAPEEDPETWGELESEKLDDGDEDEGDPAAPRD
jgi:hypothetical protein